MFSLLQQPDELFFSSLSSSAPYGVIYQNDNANTNLAVDSLYCYDSHEVLSSNDQPFEYNNNYQSNSFSNDIYPTNDNTYSINIDAQINRLDIEDERDLLLHEQSTFDTVWQELGSMSINTNNKIND